MKVCNVHGCPELFNGKGGRCPTHTRKARKARDQAGHNAYSTTGHKRFRENVLTRDPICVIPGCIQFATVADHYPQDRKTLVALGLNPNNPKYGRGLCTTHHNQHTAATNPSGFRA